MLVNWEPSRISGLRWMRKCGDEVRELLHNGCPVACLGDAPFGCVNVSTSRVNVGFFQGAALPDPARLLQGTSTFMRHVKLGPGTATNAAVEKPGTGTCERIGINRSNRMASVVAASVGREGVATTGCASHFA
jgi:hypothetical protein